MRRKINFNTRWLYLAEDRKDSEQIYRRTEVRSGRRYRCFLCFFQLQTNRQNYLSRISSCRRRRKLRNYGDGFYRLGNLIYFYNS